MIVTQIDNRLIQARYQKKYEGCKMVIMTKLKLKLLRSYSCLEFIPVSRKSVVSDFDYNSLDSEVISLSKKSRNKLFKVKFQNS